MYQPSTMTKSKSLKGRETTLGESMLIPMARRMLATTMSTTRKGRKMRKPMRKPFLSNTFYYKMERNKDAPK